MGLSSQLVTVRCSRCWRARYVIPSEDWPVCCGEVMQEGPMITRPQFLRDEMDRLLSERRDLVDKFLALSEQFPKDKEAIARRLRGIEKLAEMAEKAR